jgi:two-component system, NarL family, response regulator YdfI
VTRVVVVASSPAVRVGLATVLAGHPGLTIFESTARSGELGEALMSIEPDVVVLALEPGESPALPLRISPDAAARLPAVLVLGDEPAAAWAGRAFRSGARGALARTASTDQIVSSVLAVAAGLVVRQPVAGESPAQPFQRPLDERTVQPLTGREIEILGLLTEGLGNKAIAGRLGISEHTVKSHLTSIFAKLDVSTRAEAVASAARLGLIML